MLLFAVSVLVVAQSSSEIPEGFMNNPVFKSATLQSRLIILLVPNIMHTIMQCDA